MTSTRPRRVRRQAARAGVLVLAAGMLVAGSAPGAAQQRFLAGQAVMPAYEGWERNPDGSFNLVFGTMNRNWAEEIDIPIGRANNLEPGGPDQGQPTRFLPRRNRFLFRVRVPADFGDNEVVWTLTSPNAVSPTNVPPRRPAANNTGQTPSTKTLIATPPAATRQATAKAPGILQRRPIQPQNTTDGAAAKPTQSQTRSSAGRSTGSIRIMSDTNVAVMT